MSDKILKSIEIDGVSMNMPVYENIGEALTGSASTAITSTDINNWTKGASVNLSKGYWVVLGSWGFRGASTTGARQVGIRIYATDLPHQWQRFPIGSNAWSRLLTFTVLKVTSDNTECAVYGASDKTSAAEINFIQATKLADIQGGVVRLLKNLANSICYRPLTFGKAVA